MPAAIPLVMMAASTAASAYSAKKASNAMKMPAAQQAQQDAAMQEYTNRMKMMSPMLQGLVGGMQGRLAQSQGGMAPSIGQMRTPGAGQAVSRLARGLPGPGGQRRQRYQEAV